MERVAEISAVNRLKRQFGHRVAESGRPSVRSHKFDIKLINCIQGRY